MGCINSSDGHNQQKQGLRVLLLGIGGSGKTTFSKQMQIIHHGFDKEQAQSYGSILLANVLIGLKAISAKAKDLEDTENYKKSRWIQSVDETQVEWNEDVINNVVTLWQDEGIQAAWQEVKDNVMVQVEYLMENLDRFVQPDFIPTNDDILRARQRTTGECVTRFEETKFVWNLIDVGGQFSERQKWAGFFEEDTPHAIIFFLALDEFNIPNTELKTSDFPTKFQLALQVFREILCGDGPVNDYKLCKIVFLNKVDLFEEKIRNDKKFEEFKDNLGYNGEQTVTGCTDFIKKMLVDISNQQDNANKKKWRPKEDAELSIHVTNALDTKMMTGIAYDIKSSVATSTMRDLGMI